MRLIEVIVDQLPDTQKWTSAQRQRWIDAMTKAVDLLIEVEDAE